MTRKEQIKNAYKMTGGNSSFYDGMMTYSTFSGKAICRVVWNMNGEKNFQYLEQALSGVPENFTGIRAVTLRTCKAHIIDRHDMLCQHSAKRLRLRTMKERRGCFE